MESRVPAVAAKVPGLCDSAEPADNFALGILHIEVNMAVRIGPSNSVTLPLMVMGWSGGKGVPVMRLE